MSSISIELDDQALGKLRRVAQSRGLGIDALVQQWVNETSVVAEEPSRFATWQAFFNATEHLDAGQSVVERERGWTRESLYDRRSLRGF